ncbi:MAG TPA: glycosyltransferase, partial [Armatimonadota bacterium]|nr:glycosyltransferase [Armatimonadota bacterium]
PTYWSLPRARPAHAWGMYASLRPYLGRLRREFPFDVILAAWAYPDAAAAARLADAAGCPLVSMVLGSDINEFAGHPSLRGQIQRALRRSQRVVAVSGALRERVVDLGIAPERVIVQHNGVDGERFAPRDRHEARYRLDLPRDRRLLCYIGNFVQEKGVTVLVEAMHGLVRSGMREVSLLMVGSGPLEEQLRTRVRALGLEDSVRFCGRRPHNEIPSWMTAADVLCLPSFREGCPNVVLEALASGRPVVASAVGGVPELLDERNGVLAPAGDAEALARGMRSAVERQWDADALRATVQFLSWRQYGLTLHASLTGAVEEWNARPSASVGAALEAG